MWRYADFAFLEGDADVKELKNPELQKVSAYSICLSSLSSALQK